MENISLISFYFFQKFNQNRLCVFRDGFTGRGVRGGCTHPLALAREVCYFNDKAEKYERHNEIHVIVMICHTVSEYHL